MQLEPPRPPDPRGAAGAGPGAVATEPDPDSAPPGGLDVERSAVRSTTLLVARTVILQLFTAGATIALARLLVPSDFGAFAVAQSAQYLGRNLIELGLPAALVRRTEPPTLAEQRSMTGLMTAAAWAAAGLALAVAFVILPAVGGESRIVSLTAIALLSLPFYAVRAVPALLLERRLSYGRLVAVEVAETVAFYGFAVPAAIAGLGALSLVAAAPVSAVVGAVAAMLVQPWSFGLAFDYRLLRPLARFGLQVTAIWPLNLVRELAFASSLVAIGGRPLAGYYSMSLRIFSIPAAILSAVQRVAFVALARGSSEGRARRAAEAAGVTSVAVGLVLALAVGALHPAIGVLFGEKWQPTANVVFAASAGVFLLSGVGAILQSLALAAGDARLPAVAALVHAAVALAAVWPLASAFGTWGAGAAFSVGAVSFVGLLLARGARESRACVSPALRALAVAAAAAAVGNAVTQSPTIGALVAAVAASAAAWVVLALLLTLRELRLLARLLRRHLGPAGSDAAAPVA